MTLFAPVILLKKATICHLKGHFDIKRWTSVALLHNNGVLFYFIKSSVHVKITALFPTIFTSKDNFLFPSWPRLSRPVFNAMLLCFVKVPWLCVHRYWTLAVNRVCETDSKNKLGKKKIHHLTPTFNNQETSVRAWWEIRCWLWVSAAAERISNCFKPVKKKIWKQQMVI